MLTSIKTLAYQKKQNVHRYDGNQIGKEAPPYTVAAPSYRKPINTDETAMIDFDGATFGEHINQRRAPVVYQPPEVLLNLSPTGSSADIG